MKLAIVAGLALTTSLLAVDKEPAKRLEESAAVFSEIMATPDKGIPQDLLEKAHCIVIVPEPEDGGFHRRRQVRKGISLVPQQERHRLVGARHSAYRRRQRRLSDRRLHDRPDHAGHESSAERTNCCPASSLWARKDRLPRGRWAAPRPLKPTPRCTPRFSRGRGPRACLPASRWKGRRCGRISTITRRSTARSSKTGKS